MLCEVSRGEQVFSLTKLRRHQDNYHVPNTDPARPDFVLNICGPLVTADVNSSSCNPHSACALVDNEYMVCVSTTTYDFQGENFIATRVLARLRPAPTSTRTAP